MKKLNNSGFSAIEAVLIVIIIAALGGVGYYVYQAKNKVPSVSNNTTQNSDTSKTNAKEAQDPTLSWTTYKDPKGNFTLRYPKTWVTATHPEFCSDGLLLLGPDDSSVGKCGSESIGEVFIAVNTGDTRTDLAKGTYKDVESKDVVIAEVKGTRQSGTVQNQPGDTEGVGGLPDGTKTVSYQFYTKDKTYTIEYNQTPEYPDVLSDFDLLVTKTFKFSN